MIQHVSGPAKINVPQSFLAHKQGHEEFEIGRGKGWNVLGFCGKVLVAG